MNKTKRIISLLMVVMLIAAAMLGTFSAISASKPEITLKQQDGKLKVYSDDKLVKSYNFASSSDLTLTTSKSKNRPTMTFKEPSGKKRSIVLPSASAITVTGTITKVNTGASYNSVPLTLDKDAKIGSSTISGTADIVIEGDIGTLNIKSTPDVEFKTGCAVNQVVAANESVSLNVQSNANVQNIAAPKNTRVTGAGASKSNITTSYNPNASKTPTPPPVSPPVYNPGYNPGYYPGYNPGWGWNGGYYPPAQVYNINSFNSITPETVVADSKLYSAAAVSNYLLNTRNLKAVTGTCYYGASYKQVTFGVTGWTFVPSGNNTVYDPTNITTSQRFKAQVSVGSGYNKPTNVDAIVDVKLGVVQTAACALCDGVVGAGGAVTHTTHKKDLISIICNTTAAGCTAANTTAAGAHVCDGKANGGNCACGDKSNAAHTPAFCLGKLRYECRKCNYKYTPDHTATNTHVTIEHTCTGKAVGTP